jgi:gamma-glutamylputrescine oxidase
MKHDSGEPRAPARHGVTRLSRRDVLKRGGLAVAGTLAGGAAIDAAAPFVLREPIDVDQNQSHWSQALPPPQPALGRSIDADVVVVGGGLTGLSTALYLRERAPGKRVVLLDARRCGNGASARNGAMLLTMTPDRWLRASDEPALDRRILALTVDNIAVLREMAARFAVDIELDTPGAAHLLMTAAEAREARDSATKLRDNGMPVEFWDRERVRDELGSAVYAGALVDVAAGQLHPGKLVGLFRTAALAAGVEVYENTPVTSVDEGPVHTVTTVAGYRVRAPVLVLATNAYSSQLGYLRNAYVPLVAYVGITRPLDDAIIARLGWKSRVPFDDSRTDEHWLGLTRDNRIRIGGGPQGYGYGFNNGAPPAAVPGYRAAALAAELERIYPTLGKVEFERCWDGAVDCSLNLTASVGRIGRHDNVYYAIGYSGHGVNLTSVFGRVLADMIAGQDDRWQWLPYANRRLPYIPNEPFRWLGIRAIRAVVGALGT